MQKRASAFSVRAEHHVVNDVHIAHKSHAETVFGNERKANAEFSYLKRGLVSEIFGLSVFRVVVKNFAGLKFLKSRDGFKQFSLPAARNARNAEDFSRTRRERYVVKYLNAVPVFAVKAADYESVRRVFGLGSVYVETDFFADHHFGQLRLVCIFRYDRSDIFSLSQNGNFVGKVKNLMQFVGDYDYGLAVLFHLAKHREKFFCFLRGQTRRRLVKNEYVSAAVKNFDYLNGLFFGNGHIGNALHRVYLKTVSLAYRANFFDALFRVEFFIVETENYILSRRENVDEFEVLVYHSDTVRECVFRGTDNDFFAVYQNFARVGKIYSRNHIHQRRFSASVFAENRKNLSSVDGHRNVLVRNDASEGLCNISQFYCGCFHF